MNARAKQILKNVTAAMQDAEELGGPTGREYLELMREISKEAMRRHDAYLFDTSKKSGRASWRSRKR